MSSEISSERGKWIVIEGADLVDTEAQVAKLAAALRPNISRFDDPSGEIGYDIVQEADAREEQWKNDIEPALKAGKHVISSGSWVHDVIHLGMFDVSHLDTMRVNHSLANDELLQPKPDVLIVLDATPPAAKTSDPAKIAKTDTSVKFREGLHAIRWNIITRDLGKIVMIDAAEAAETVHRQVQETVEETLGMGLELPLEEEVYQ